MRTEALQFHQLLKSSKLQTKRSLTLQHSAQEVQNHLVFLYICTTGKVWLLGSVDHAIDMQVVLRAGCAKVKPPSGVCPLLLLLPVCK